MSDIIFVTIINMYLYTLGFSVVFGFILWTVFSAVGMIGRRGE